MDSNPLTQDELDHLAEVREVCQTANSAGYRRILAQMQRWADEALEVIRESPYASDSVKAAMQMRWAQRESILRGVVQYVQTCLDEKEALLLEAKQQRSVPTEEYAERSDQAPGWTN